MSLSRPSLGGRTVSNIHPLITPTAQKCDKDLGHGPNAASAYSKVSSGRRMVLGCVTPFFPSLNLHPPPPADKVKALHRSGAPLGISLTAPLSYQREVSSNDISRQPATENDIDVPAPLMIRSYSMPVATQRDFEAQRKAVSIRRIEYLSQLE